MGNVHTLAVHVSGKIKLRHIVCRGSFNPDALPNTTAGSVEDMRRD